MRLRVPRPLRRGDQEGFMQEVASKLKSDQLSESYQGKGQEWGVLQGERPVWLEYSFIHSPSISWAPTVC